MSKKVESQIRKRIQATGRPEEVDQLCLDGIEIKSFSTNGKKMLENCTKLEYLTLNGCKLKTLENFPHLRKLVVLELSDNELTGDDFSKLGQWRQLSYLTLDNNQIQDMANIKLLTCLPDLQILQVHGNSISESFEYRETIFSYLPSLTVLDCEDRNGRRVQEEDPSQYIYYREPRSHINFSEIADDDLLENAEQRLTQNNSSSNSWESLGQPGRNSGRGGGLSVRRQSTHPRPHYEIMNIRTAIQEDSDSEQENELMRDFSRKLRKKQ